MALTKAHIIESVSNHCNLPKKRSAQLVESTLEMMKKTVENGEGVLISRFGKFCVKEKNERRGRNPETGEGLTLGAGRGVTFKCSPVLRDRINEAG